MEWYRAVGITMDKLMCPVGSALLQLFRGSTLDDLTRRDPIYKDLAFIEKHFNGIMPFEITIDTKRKRGVMKYSTIERIDRLQNVLAEYSEVSKSLSVSDVVKFARQAFYNGNPDFYDLPNTQELNFMLRYIPRMEMSY